MLRDTHHLTAWFEGHVQGVGFRYATLQIAREFEVAGFVENLADGRVHLQAEGEVRELEAFLAEIESRLESYIRKTEKAARVRAAQFTGFVIK